MSTAELSHSVSTPVPLLSPSISFYPSGPLVQFPPPLPSHRLPLRERCGFTQSLKIQTNFSRQPRCSPWSPKGHIQPHRNNVPRRRRVKAKHVVLKDDDSPVVEAEPVDLPLPAGAYDIPARTEQRHLQEVIPGLFLAFKLSDEAEDDEHMRKEGYTHIIDICYALPGCDGGVIKQMHEDRVHRLRLTLPELSRPSSQSSERAGLALSDAQLRTARDMLAQTLPWRNAVDAPGELYAAPSGPRVLISTPAHRPTDAMAVVGCYLSFASGKSVETSLRFIDDEQDFLSIWKGEVSGDEEARVEHIARLSSWLSNVRR
ncbi:uncharacterized protein LAESUDRAFT_731176 [Laetiporus sulphureus 93-53]|uniref:Uncharacterized protein n=1 Tax=Laetiporus sulphureus 93-53 TaxID=1314785 RepID=A0A165BQH4_9APHY|nr:uncharacterized protein LAESUDRAFT_731176 [Laetiporus sulphureus 93-53]KZT01469.1 hypothetical protein LAESUDRAFT_731176 [Laetiporus sulphureus 93-53]